MSSILAGPATLLYVKRRIHAVRLLFRKRTTRGSTLTGQADVRFGRWKGLPAVGPAAGRLISGRGTKRVLLQAKGLRLDSLAVPTRARLRLRVIGSTRYQRCPLGARATLLVTDFNNIRPGRPDHKALSEPATRLRWKDHPGGDPGLFSEVKPRPKPLTRQLLWLVRNEAEECQRQIPTIGRAPADRPSKGSPRPASIVRSSP